MSLTNEQLVLSIIMKPYAEQTALEKQACIAYADSVGMYVLKTGDGDMRAIEHLPGDILSLLAIPADQWTSVQGKALSPFTSLHNLYSVRVGAYYKLTHDNVIQPGNYKETLRQTKLDECIEKMEAIWPWYEQTMMLQPDAPNLSRTTAYNMNQVLADTSCEGEIPDAQNHMERNAMMLAMIWPDEYAVAE